jgi:dihydroflavonol-4-reductase
VIVNPTFPVGPRDMKPSPTGQTLVDFLRRAFPAFVDTGINVVDVRDVAKGHVLALERGTPGQRYLLGSAQGNMTLRELLGLLSEVTGLPAPNRRVPWWLALTAAYIDHFIEGMLLRRQPRIPLEGTKHARKVMWVDPSKAIRELGLPQSPVKDALRKAVEWYISTGYVDKSVPPTA